MNVIHFADEIFTHEKKLHPEINKYEKIIYVSAAIHDMCDKKYMNETEGIKEIENFLKEDLTSDELYITKQIIQTMSYSTVKKNGFPDLKEHQMAYHIVREADLLAAYDFDRCMIYNMHKKHGNVDEAFEDASNLFNNRVLCHNNDGLFITDYSKKNYKDLHMNSIRRMDKWAKLLRG
jgi:hypothetical protein